MLVRNVNGEAVGASMVKNSEFYIELAKFVQAYSVIIENPNEFLQEVGEQPINEKTDKLLWNQFVKIITNCDFGFNKIPTEIDLKVFYNYAIEMGSLDSVNKKMATIRDVADAQKHYYNFVDKAKDDAEAEYLKQHKVYLSRETEMRNADNALSKQIAGIVFSYIMLMFSAFIGIFGIISFFFDNVIVSAIGELIPVWKQNYIGGIVLIIFAILLFFLFNKMYEKFKRKHFKLKKATETIFARGNDSYLQEVALKRKLSDLYEQLKIVHTELNDKNKKFDVQENINKLKASNKYYQKFTENEYISDVQLSSDDEKDMRVEDFAPVTLTREQEENLRRVGKEAISLEGQYDLEAYKEKFEKSRSKDDEQEEMSEMEEKEKRMFDVDEQKQKELQEKQNQEQLESQEKELLESIDYIKEILGFSDTSENEKSK